ncbi:hypothetical protein B296_00052871 [Ensete ventricosum]|uniref:Uncharacterized protein n=1 Tax=Ensete ventricosum TaxID=4639 RepID=A0A426YAH5_ENSVE|nr:hypothetical protein B296_00052871 [Ensete ventricosum]
MHPVGYRPYPQVAAYTGRHCLYGRALPPRAVPLHAGLPTGVVLASVASASAVPASGLTWAVCSCWRPP